MNSVSREELLTKQRQTNVPFAAEQGALPEPWYCRKVHPGIIAAAAVMIVITFFAVKFWPVRTAPPITVVGQGDFPQATKSTLPATLLPFLPSASPQPKAETNLPPPPLLTTRTVSAKLPPAVESVLAPTVPPALPTEAPTTTGTANEGVRP
ncbi:MAG: hypothetical protein JO323_18385 [Acidobacteriia bacterium]|nr:hypothetical protein [Terriglobia bacterium]